MRRPSGGGRLRADPRSPEAASSPGPRVRRPARHEGRPAAAGHWRAQRTGPGASPASTCPTSGASARASAPPPAREPGLIAMRMRQIRGRGRAAHPELQLVSPRFSPAPGRPTPCGDRTTEEPQVRSLAGVRSLQSCFRAVTPMCVLTSPKCRRHPCTRPPKPKTWGESHQATCRTGKC